MVHDFVRFILRYNARLTTARRLSAYKSLRALATTTASSYDNLRRGASHGRTRRGLLYCRFSRRNRLLITMYYVI